LRGAVGAGWDGFLLRELGGGFGQLALALQVLSFELRVGALLHVGVFAEYACHSDISFDSV
jgi:hypothetical protein